MCKKIAYISSAIACFMLTVGNAYANDFSLSGNLSLQHSINSKDYTRGLLSADSKLLYSYTVKDSVSDKFTVGSSVGIDVKLASDVVDDTANDSSKYLLNVGANSAYVFLKLPNIGSIEVGLAEPVANSMRISSSKISVASGGISGSYLEHVSLKADSKKYPYGFDKDGTILVKPGLYIASACGHEIGGPVLNYYSPEFKGFKAGFSYIPKDKDAGGYNDIIDIGIKYENKLSNLNYSFSGVIEHARLNSEEYNDLVAYNIGLSINYHDFTILGSYGNLGKSGKKAISVDTANYVVLGSEYYDLGAKFERNGFSISATYFYSNKDLKKNDQSNTEQHSLSVYALGIEKVLVDKVSVYSDLICFAVDRPTSDQQSGYVFLIGTKFKF
ncbi:porin [Ehrlichia ruminantium]|uniref:Porin domain-containing protein n=2 Tax=Ehrlichia ruminantium TaxID=779 RepID=A0A0H3LZX0_EHRRW|nr:porin [Ehrlichia ruminantium]CAH58174.1 putative exported protein [Ehrlichia ruminantium str. Welgevonden]QLK51449.1 porin [Ehrlichia ruminantium]QLK55123.1 porin [Ehrlichia ruminantium]QLK56040.1 porin [Ehrlichia ruminantium]